MNHKPASLEEISMIIARAESRTLERVLDDHPEIKKEYEEVARLEREVQMAIRDSFVASTGREVCERSTFVAKNFVALAFRKYALRPVLARLLALDVGGGIVFAKEEA